MSRVAFFGLNDVFSTVQFEALVRSGVQIPVVVLGIEAPRGGRRRTEILRAKRSFWNRRRRRGPEPPPKNDLIAIAHAVGANVIRTSWANDSGVVDRLRRLDLDAHVVCGFPHLLNPTALAVARRGGLNVHPGALPEERGPAPLFWALKEGRTTLRWTIHVLDEHEDHGDIVFGGQVEIRPGTDGQAILRRLAEAAAPFLVRGVRALCEGDLVRTPQRAVVGRRRRRPRFRDGRIDPERSAEEVFTFVSACARTYSLFVESAEDRFFIDGALSYDPLAETQYEWVLTGDRLILRCHPGVVELQLKTDGALFAAEYAAADRRTPRGV